MTLNPLSLSQFPEGQRHCCQPMAEMLNYYCEQHSEPFECPDRLIFYSAKFDEYGIIIHDGSSVYSVIGFCPWCGAKLPESKHDRWLVELDQLEFQNPTDQDIPAAYLTMPGIKQKNEVAYPQAHSLPCE